MRLSLRIWFGPLMLLALANSPQAWGEYSYQYVISPASATVNPGGSVLLGVSLQERVTNGSVSRLTTDGLIGAGVRISFGSGSAAQVLSVADIAFNAAFDGAFQSRSVTPGVSAELTETVDFASPAVTASALGNGVYQVFLGSFRITAGSLPGVTTLITASDIPTTSDTITGAGLTLDSLIATGTATITTPSGGTGPISVPEPGSVILLGLAGAIIAGSANRRRILDRRSLSPREPARDPARFI